MQKKSFPFLHSNVANSLVRRTLLVLPVAVLTGSLVALFIWLLDVVTIARWNHGWLLFFLPIAGIGIHFLYKNAGKNAEGGNSLIVEEIYEPVGGVPTRMTPLVLSTTLITHLFGGSAGREGTAVQMGGSIASLVSRWFSLPGQDVSIMLMAGIAAGFSAVFGTPIAGTVFALEVALVGTTRYYALLPCLIASLVADITCVAWGVQHMHYPVAFARSSPTISFMNFEFFLLLKVMVAGVFFGLAAYLFIKLQQKIKTLANRFISPKWLIPFLGGLMIIGLCYLLGTRDYLGLGVVSNSPTGVSIVSSFKQGGATYLSWFWKLLFTAITLGTGFKGGEVTPLFFIGAALGNTLAVISGAPVDLVAALGFIAVFAGATNTPLACTIMGVELFGGAHILYFTVACFTAYYCSGRTGIYTSQRPNLVNGSSVDKNT